MIRRKHLILVTVASLGLSFWMPVTSYGQQENRGSDRRDDVRDQQGFRGEPMKFEELPDAVRRSVRQELQGDEKITTVTRVQRGGDFVYRVELEGRERSRALILGKEGKIQENTNITDRGADVVRLRDLPEAVQQTIREQAKGREVMEVHQITRNNETYYRARIQDRGADVFVNVGRDGRVQNVLDRDDPQRNQRDNANATVQDVRRKIAWNDVPNAAQRAIKDQTQGREVEEIMMITHGGETWYRFRLDRPGDDRYVFLDKEGKVQHTARIDEEDRNPTRLSDRRAQQDRNRPADRNVQDVRRRIAWNEVPNAAQRAIKDQTRGREVEDITQITHGGETWYRFRLDRPGDDRYIFIDEAGKVQHTARIDDEDRRPVRLSDIRRDREDWQGWKRERVDPQRLPGEVKNALGKNEVKLDQLSDAWVNSRDGRTVYHVIERGPTRDMHYRVTAEGRFLGEDNVTEEGRQRVEFRDLPGEAKSALLKHGKDDDFRRIFAVTRGNQTFYEARHENGDTIRVGRSGDLVDRQGDEIRR